MDAAHPLLGDVLVMRGLLTQDELKAALEEQRRSGRRLGEIIVDRGLVSRGALATALGEQAGGIVRTEYGVSFGFGSTAPPRATEPAPAEPAQLDPPTVQERRPELENAIAEKRRELEELTREVERLRAERDAGVDEPDVRDFFVVAVVDDRYELHLARGAPPRVGSDLRLPGAPDARFVVDRERWRRCVYLRRAAT